eukprot:CAMPEP_0181044038 /NCGR_PEP_ID=MMETSP1070-20121207/13039_1 /TAXON_ID=265543 /ORGANISM="Minutocellus polymorphus, Strain NH13" /LENGTH=292 /DNA_ID=CAMNT_0023122429 /DNA_START=12 /DNA_END=890 /DNA_ORIENTATION=+
MSANQHDNDHRSRSKSQKRGDGDDDDEDEAAPIIALGGPMYDEATARKMLKEVVLNDEEVEDEPIVGFDPDDAALDNTYYVYGEGFEGEHITPMIYFAGKGDVQMCRYLISRGASTTKWSIGNSWNPLQAAAGDGHLEVCKVLHANGAKNDIWKEDDAGWTPVKFAAIVDQYEVVRWLVLQGALCANDKSEEIEPDRIYREFDEDTSISHTCDRLVKWADEVTSSHSSVVMFLLGTLPPPPNADQSCILQCLGGHPGVRKHVADFVGMEVTKGKHLRILRQVKDGLPRTTSM